MRYALDISYKGTQYAGWQVQPNAMTVQEQLERALQIIMRQKIEVLGSGRTDAGVHALQQIVHFDYEGDFPEYFCQRVNAILPNDIAVNSLHLPSKTDFHARFDAVFRAYQYHLSRKKDPMREGLIWLYKGPEWDMEGMKIAARMLLEYDDFASFNKTGGGQKTTLCKIMRADFELTEAGWVFHLKANRFLRGMVRAIVGTLVQVGQGKITVEDFRSIIEAKDRSKAGLSAPASGLFLSEVKYPEGYLGRKLQ